MIDYKMIAASTEWYTRMGYAHIEVPWVVSASSINVTKPKEARSVKTFMGQLVGSGEQSFIEIRKELCPGRKYQCVTPCFRDDKLDEIHLPYFLKNELIIVLWKNDDPKEPLDKICNDAMSLFRHYCGCGTVPKIEQTDIGFDITLMGIEIGSYGYREYKDFRWVYGTGLAEPRFSHTLILQREANERADAELMDSIK